MRPLFSHRILAISFVLLMAAHAAEPALTLSWEEKPLRDPRRSSTWLTIHGAHLPAPIVVHYLEAYVRANSTDRNWGESVIGHQTKLLSIRGDRKQIKLRDTLADGVVLEHTITAGRDEVDFRIEAHNPTSRASEAHWAQPCVRIGDFCGHGQSVTKNNYAYLASSFIFLDGKLARMPTQPWATEALYQPGQVWCPPSVPRTDVNPRPLSSLVPGNGLIGCFSGDGKTIWATAWEPYQELFQGVIRCLHSDFRLGGLKAGERKSIRGKIYLVPNDVPALLARYAQDFPEQVADGR
jgi:hypothetical protein